MPEPTEQSRAEAGRLVYDSPDPQDTAERALWAHAANRDQTRTGPERVRAVRQAVAIALRGCFRRMPELTEAEIREAVEAELAMRMTPAEVGANEESARGWLEYLHEEGQCHAHGAGVRCCFDILDSLVTGVRLELSDKKWPEYPRSARPAAS